MRILVTGNMGYVGSVLAPHLASTFGDAEVIGFDRGFFAAKTLPNCLKIPELCLNAQYFGDVRAISEKNLEGVDAVIHLAAVSNDPMGKAFEKATMQVNRDATIRLAEMAKVSGVRSFVFASSCSVYGATGEKPVNEDSPLNPLTAYAKSKVESELALAKLADKNFRVTCLRFATACGFSPRLRLDLVLNDFVMSALSENVVTLLSQGTSWRPLIHVKDMARALVWALQRGGEPFVTMNCGSQKFNRRIIDLAADVADICGVQFKKNDAAVADARSYQVDFSRFEKLAPDHQPIWDAIESIQELKTEIDGAGLQDRAFRSGGFMRLVILRRMFEDGMIDELLWAKHEYKSGKAAA